MNDVTIVLVALNVLVALGYALADKIDRATLHVCLAILALVAEVAMNA